VAIAKTDTKAGEFTYSDYLRWPENERWQLLDGFAYAMAPPLVQHQIVVTELGAQLISQLRGQRCKALVAPVGVRLPKHNEANEHVRTVFEPDVLVVCDPSKIERTGIRGAPDFIIEVLSPSTASFDQIEKRHAYGAAGVRELWLVEIASGVLTIYRTGEGGFAPATIVRAEGVIAIEALPGVSIDLAFMHELRERDEDFA
jgi:Uma2 family endonuclease